MKDKSSRESRYIIGMRVDYTTYGKAADMIVSSAKHEEGGYVCVANAHMALEANRDPKFKQIVNSADLVTPDGMPLVFLLKLKGVKDAVRVYGTDLTLTVCEKAQLNNIPIGFYGGTEETLRLMISNLKSRWPLLNVAYAFSPSFSALKKEEDDKVVEEIKRSGAKVLFVGLGCPKQEMWMAEHRDRISAIMVGVGAAFDFISGAKQRAPHWMQKNALEWLWRLIHEPKRLWKRYLIGNAVFIWLVLKELINEKAYNKICKKKAYNKICKRYEERHDEIFNPIEQDRLTKRLGQAVGWGKTLSSYKIALDYGCGSGNLTRHLIDNGFYVVAADVSDNCITFVKHKYGGTGKLVNTLKVNGRDLSGIDANHFDFVGTYSVLHHVHDYLYIVKELVRVTKNGGLIYLDYESNESYWAKDRQYIEFIRLALRPSLKKWKRYLKLSKYIKKILEILVPWYQPEGDIHIWPDDHIRWDAIESLLIAQDCEILFKEDYLRYKTGYPVDIYEEYKNKGCNDMRLLVARKNGQNQNL